MYSIIFKEEDAHEDPIYCCAWAKTDATEKASGSLQTTITGHTSWVLDATFSPEGKRIASSGADKTVRLYSLDGSTLNVFKEHEDAVWGIKFNKEGNKLISVSKDKCINIYECPVVKN